MNNSQVQPTAPIVVALFLTGLNLYLASPLLAAPKDIAKIPGSGASEKFEPYFLGGGVVGNGSDDLKLTPDDSTADGDAVIEIPESFKNTGFIRVEGKENIDGSFQSFHLVPCKGGGIQKNGNYEGPSGACSGQILTHQTIYVDLNKKTRIPPGLYLLSTLTLGEKEDEAGSSIFHPAVIRIEKHRTTVVPLPKIVLPSISDDMSAGAFPQIDKKSMQLQLIFSTWLSSGTNDQICKGKPYVRKNPYPWNWVDEDAVNSEFRKLCQQVTGTNWRKIIPFWKFETLSASYPKDDLYFVDPIIDTYRNKIGSRGSWMKQGYITRGTPAGASISTFPGIYTLEFSFSNGLTEKTKGVVVGNFSEKSIGQVFPKKN